MSATTIPAKVLRAAAEASANKDAAAKLEKDNAVLSERADTLEQRCAELLAARITAEEGRVAAVEELRVAHAERKLVEETITRADALVGELRAERSALLSRVTEAEGQAKALQKQAQAAEEARAAVAEAYAVEQVERRAVVEKSERVGELLNLGRRRHNDHEEEDELGESNVA